MVSNIVSQNEEIVSARGRYAAAERVTGETSISIKLNIDGTGKTDISTGIGFYDHMLTSFAVHGGFDLQVHVVGDIHIDGHHTIEDTAIVLGQVFGQALGNKSGIERFGDVFIPMDETLVQAIVDLSGRPYSVFTGEPEYMLCSSIQGNQRYDTVLNKHFFETFAFHSKMNLHIRVLYGRDPHHITEAEYKATARALRKAVKRTCDHGVPSTKGVLS